MQTKKPQPLMKDGKPHYTLSSYEPVEIDLVIFHATPQDIEDTLALALEGKGATAKDLSDAAWLQENFGVESEAELREMLESFVSDTYEKDAEEQKAGMCLDKLVQRLEQSVTTADVDRCRQNIMLDLEIELEDRNVTFEQFLAQSGRTREQFDAHLEEEAIEAAEEIAALDAFAAKRKIKVSRQEMPSLLGIPSSEAREFMRRADALGRIDEIREVALHTKTMNVIVAECVCNRHYETAETARERGELLQRLHGGGAPVDVDDGGDGESDGSSGSGRSTNLRLV